MIALRFFGSLFAALLGGEATAIAVTHTFPIGGTSGFIVTQALAFAILGIPLTYLIAVRPLQKRLAGFSADQDRHIAVLDDLRRRIAERDHEVAATQGSLADTNVQLDAAMNNMRQGL